MATFETLKRDFTPANKGGSAKIEKEDASHRNSIGRMAST
jgi:hypothetical protein